jgi:tetratricopeptide (TPR) repeat protein
MKQLIILLGLLFISSSFSNAQADCAENPPDGLAPIAAYSLFQGNFKDGDFAFALKYGRWFVCNNIESVEGVSSYRLDRQYDRMITIYGELGRESDDESLRKAYVDTALTLYSDQLELFGDDPDERFDIILKRGRFYQTNYDIIEGGLQKAYQDYVTLFEMDPERALNLGDGYYLRQALNNFVRNDDTDGAQALIDAVKPYAEGEMLDYIEEEQQDLLGSPEERITYFEAIVEENPEDVNAWNELADAYESTGDREKRKEVLLKLNELDPTYDITIELAELAESDANYRTADQYLKEALELTDDNEERIELYLRIADANISMDNFSAAKGFVHEALSINPNSGNALIKMATVYGSAVTNCVDSGDRNLQAEDKVVFWLVIDYLNKAKRVDPSVANSVDRQFSTYEEVTPNSEDKFFTLDLKNGDSITIDGSLMSCYSFINETTTVR